MSRSQVNIVAITGAAAVGIGAFGAHALKPLLDPNQMEVFKTASFYHFVHAVAMLQVALRRGEHHPSLDQSFGLWGLGILLFSGSLYIIAILPLLGATTPALLGMVTPLGGLFLIGGWLNLLRYRPSRHHSGHSHQAPD